MGRKQKDESADDDLDEDLEVPADKVKRPLSAKEIEKRKIRLGELTSEYFGIKAKRRAYAKKSNDKMSELEDEMKNLSTEITTEHQLLDAQMELAEAKTSRRSAERGRNQDAGAAVEP